MPVKSLTVYCAARNVENLVYARAATELGAELAKRNITIVYGGGSVGLMGAVADAAIANGGRVIGVIPEALVDKEHAHAGITETHVVGTMHDRKAMLSGLAEAFVCLPGGVGTMDELFEAVTWNQIGIQDKPVYLLDVEGFWTPLKAFLERVGEIGFVPQTTLDRIHLVPDVGTLMEHLA